MPAGLKITLKFKVKKKYNNVAHIVNHSLKNKKVANIFK